MYESAYKSAFLCYFDPKAEIPLDKTLNSIVEFPKQHIFPTLNLPLGPRISAYPPASVS